MADKTKIEWTDATWNPVGGCSVVSPGCKHCYAMPIAASGRLREHPLYKGTTTPTKAGPVFNGHLTSLPADHPTWTWPLRWRGAKAPKLGPGKSSMIFVCDMSDLFHEDRPDEVIDRVFAVMALAPQHIFQILTKRPARMRDYFAAADRAEAILDHAFSPHAPTPIPIRLPLLNVWLGVTAEDQTRADERISALLATPAAKRFVSYEPALGPVDLSRWLEIGGLDTDLGLSNPGLDWIIAGGESGKDARPAHPDWFRNLRDQCAGAAVPFFFKQWGEWMPLDLSIRNGRRDWMILDAGGDLDIPDGRVPDDDAGEVAVARVGKRNSGALLDGREHREFPA